MKTLKGVVIADNMVKTAVVLIERKYRHPLYGKIISRRKKIHASNKMGAKVGQTVKIRETRPIAKTVSFEIVEIIGAKPEKKIRVTKTMKVKKVVKVEAKTR